MSTWINAAIRTALLAVLTVYVVFFMPGQIGGIVRSEAEKTRAEVLGVVDYRMAAVQASTVDQVAGVRHDMTTELNATLMRVDDALALADATETDVNKQVTSISVMADRRLAAIQSDTNKQLTAISGKVDQVLKPAGAAASQINAALPDFLDCQITEDGVGNKGCFYARYNDLSSEMDQTLLAVARAAPEMAENAKSISGSADHISADVSSYVHDLTMPQTKMAAIRSWLITIARITGAVI